MLQQFQKDVKSISLSTLKCVDLTVFLFQKDVKSISLSTLKTLDQLGHMFQKDVKSISLSTVAIILSQWKSFRRMLNQ